MTSLSKMRPCPCGSGQDSMWQYDARGIPLCRTCPSCHQQRMGGYRPEVLTDPNYVTSEQIDEDTWFVPDVELEEGEMRDLKEILADTKRLRDELNEHNIASPLVNSAVASLDVAVDDLEDKLASDQRRQEEDV